MVASLGGGLGGFGGFEGLRTMGQGGTKEDLFLVVGIIGWFLLCPTRRNLDIWKYSMILSGFANFIRYIKTKYAFYLIGFQRFKNPFQNSLSCLNFHL